jgi:hypothetical protein
MYHKKCLQRQIWRICWRRISSVRALQISRLWWRYLQRRTLYPLGPRCKWFFQRQIISNSDSNSPPKRLSGHLSRPPNLVWVRSGPTNLSGTPVLRGHLNVSDRSRDRCSVGYRQAGATRQRPNTFSPIMSPLLSLRPLPPPLNRHRNHRCPFSMLIV